LTAAKAGPGRRAGIANKLTGQAKASNWVNNPTKTLVAIFDGLIF
jgi:hypothetical protein